jgi:ribosomal protein L44E
MANRQLTQVELSTLAEPLIDHVRKRLQKLSAGDPNLLWALRRKLAKELIYDERGKPMFRRKLKALKRTEQKGRCAICQKALPDKNAVLDRIVAMRGYTLPNTRLLCRECDFEVQFDRRFA